MFDCVFCFHHLMLWFRWLAVNINQLVIKSDLNNNFEFSPFDLTVVLKNLFIKADNFQINQVNIPPLDKCDLKNITLMNEGSFLILQLFVRHTIGVDINFSIKSTYMNKSLISNYNNAYDYVCAGGDCLISCIVLSCLISLCTLFRIYIRGFAICITWNSIDSSRRNCRLRTCSLSKISSNCIMMQSFLELSYISNNWWYILVAVICALFILVIRLSIDPYRLLFFNYWSR